MKGGLSVVALFAGMASFLGAWMVSALNPSFRWHMIGHMMIVTVCAPLITFAIAGSRWDPVTARPSLFSPLFASLAEFFVVWIWHMPRLHDAARSSATFEILEQVSFLLSGLYFWISILGGDFRLRMEREATGIVALLLTAMHMTLLGALLALAPRNLYVHIHDSGFFDPIRDQHWGGVIMLIWGSAAYSGAALWLSRKLLASPRIV